LLLSEEGDLGRRGEGGDSFTYLTILTGGKGGNTWYVVEGGGKAKRRPVEKKKCGAVNLARVLPSIRGSSGGNTKRKGGVSGRRKG